MEVEGGTQERERREGPVPPGGEGRGGGRAGGGGQRSGIGSPGIPWECTPRSLWAAQAPTRVLGHFPETWFFGVTRSQSNETDKDLPAVHAGFSDMGVLKKI